MRLLGDRFPAMMADLWTDEDTVEVSVPADQVVEALRTLRDDPDFGFFMLADEAAVDYGPGRHFEVVYHLYSDRHPAWLRLRTRVDRQSPHIPTITSLWPGAMFHEREMYDMMGIIFDGNRDLRRIYMSPDYRSFPQRRDFLLPDDAADSPAAGIDPLERPETWDLTHLTDSAAGGEMATDDGEMATAEAGRATGPAAVADDADRGPEPADTSRSR